MPSGWVKSSKRSIPRFVKNTPAIERTKSRRVHRSMHAILHKESRGLQLIEIIFDWLNSPAQLSIGYSFSSAALFRARKLSWGLFTEINNGSPPGTKQPSRERERDRDREKNGWHGLAGWRWRAVDIEWNDVTISARCNAEKKREKKVAWNEGKINRPLIPKGACIYVWIYERNSRFKAASSNRGRITGTIERKHGFSRINPSRPRPVVNWFAHLSSPKKRILIRIQLSPTPCTDHEVSLSPIVVSSGTESSQILPISRQIFSDAFGRDSWLNGQLREVINRSSWSTSTRRRGSFCRVYGATCVAIGGYDPRRLLFTFDLRFDRSATGGESRVWPEWLDRLNYDARYVTGRKRVISRASFPRGRWIRASWWEERGWSFERNGYSLDFSSKYPLKL